MTFRFDNFIHFETQIANGRIRIGAIPGYMTKFIHCPDCGERCWRINYRGKHQYLAQTAAGDRWCYHQCPHPQGTQWEWADDEQQRDGDGELV